jgi:hypothetical protein
MQQLRTILILVFVVLSFCLRSQNVPYLEKKVSLNKNNQPLSLVLKEISTQIGVVFSYNPAQVNDQRKVSINVFKTPLRLVLDELLKGSKCSYKLKKNYVIITYDPKLKEEAAPPVVLNGYIYNSKDSSLIENASVYIASGKHSAVSDEYGYFSVSYPKQQNLVSLSVARENYVDTTLVLLNPSKEKIKIYLEPRPVVFPIDTLSKLELKESRIAGTADSIAAVVEKDRFMKFWLRLKKMKSNFKNINDTLFSDFSVSLFPPISTNKLLAINTVNKVSFNILVGHSKGIRYFELGGLFNIDNGKVSYVQVGGLGNVVADTLKGLQVGGLFNTVRTHVYGTQIGGIFNTARSVDGFQLGGIFNATKGNVNGMQLGGIVNIADTVTGMQLAGIVNKAGDCSGVQIAGICNYARKMKGFQLALINVADTCEGAPFGLFSYVKHGYHKVELSANELRFIQLGFRSGVEKLHNIFFAGVDPFAVKKMWTYGYGIGSTHTLKGRWKLTTELSAQQLQPIDKANTRLSLLNRVYAGVDFVCASTFRLGLGPSFNVLVSDTQSEYYPNVVMLANPYTFYNHTEGQTNIRMWVGGTLSIKLL